MKPIPQSPVPITAGLTCCGCDDEGVTSNQTPAPAGLQTSPPTSPSMRVGASQAPSPRLEVKGHPDVPGFDLRCPSEIFAWILVFVGASSAVRGLGSSTKELRSSLFSSREVWYTLCKVAGKLSAFRPDDDRLSQIGAVEFYEYYKCNPTVPIDVPSVNVALKRVLRPCFLPSLTSNLFNQIFPKLDRTIFVLPTKCHSIDSSLVVDEFNNNSVVKILGVGRALPKDDAPPTTIIYHTTRPNEPLLYIKRGGVLLQNLHLIHHCRGTDIWEGNSTVMVKSDGPTSVPSSHASQLEPSQLSQIFTPMPDNPRLFAYNCVIKSTSGRGIVATSSEAYLDNVVVDNCAATGVYIGRGRSAHSICGSLIAMSCDISGNGTGGRLPSQQPSTYPLVAPGHSGVYGQDGTILAADCNISGNTYTGISNTGPRGVVILDKTDIMGNASIGLELPDPNDSDANVQINDCDVSNNDWGDAGPRGRKRANLDKDTVFNPDNCDPECFIGRLSKMKRSSGIANK